MGRWARRSARSSSAMPRRSGSSPALCVALAAMPGMPHLTFVGHGARWGRAGTPWAKAAARRRQRRRPRARRRHRGAERRRGGRVRRRSGSPVGVSPLTLDLSAELTALTDGGGRQVRARGAQPGARASSTSWGCASRASGCAPRPLLPAGGYCVLVDEVPCGPRGSPGRRAVCAGSAARSSPSSESRRSRRSTLDGQARSAGCRSTARARLELAQVPVRDAARS